MNQTTEEHYSIPERFRRMENLHIVFWLGKDISWCLIFKPMAIAMVVPTIVISLIIAYRTRKNAAELAHNVAISFWITANAYWMISEFFGFDSTVIWREFTGKHLALIPFSIGALILARFYLFQNKKMKRLSATGDKL